MNAIADALVYAVTYINLYGDDDEDDDCGALESIAGILYSATREEQDALAAAAQRALEQELIGAPREEFVQDYRTWMECMFGDEWVDNRRVEQ